MARFDSPINIFALGGLGEVGKNTYCIESERSLILLDAGVRFPEANLPGVDYVIPDYTYLKNNRSKIKALFITHGHEDHIGGIPFLIRSVYIPVIYAPRLAAALIRHKLEDARIKDSVKIVEYDSDSIIHVGDDFTVSFFRVTHSIPDSFGICVDTKEGRIIDTGDFKIDLTPVGPNFELDKLARLGSEGVDLLMADSTNAEIEGYTPSETNVRAGVQEIFDKAPGRIIVSTFSSNINRIQQVVEVAVEHKRKICILGRSMETVVGISREYGYIKIPDTSLISDEDVRNYRSSDVCILCTGSQGESMAALSRIANGDHKNIRIIPGDTIVFSSNPIPGNGALVDRLVNNLVKQGADVKQNSLAFSLHSSGHPSRQELRLMLRLVNPKFFMPAHGEYRMLKLHGEIAKTIGIKPENVFICNNGDQLVLKDHKVTRGGHVQAEDIYIDGNDLDGLSSSVILDRDQLKSDGMVAVLLTVNSRTNKMVVPPIVYARGFNAASDSHVIRHSQMHAEEALNGLMKGKCTFSEIKATIKNEVSSYIYRKTERNPMIIPVIMNVNE
ncbi:MAG: ribonuclease J [Bacilli bacterium]|jgi:ribonuclease J|nr:ribonuclease J [Bacilli bacterium]MCH4210926.1 ribonuclease J [Bacilli bacterium]MCH4229128.1 ribonuclease J [Bacilli bacterium]MCI2055473.1 ribonuclease J [Bacilli bacterium]